MAILLDTGILYALADADDAWHVRTRAWIEDTGDLLIVPVTVLPEVAYLLHTRLGPDVELAFVQSVAAGDLEVEPVGTNDLARCAEVLRRYPMLGFVDASIVALAERLKIRAVATTDRRHFSAVAPKHVPRFEVLP
jgi:predicted nucleic acid-binding protein